jgi:hypothetical protein
MDRRTLSLIAAALILPLLIRFAWFFPGFAPPRSVATPDYANLKMPQAPLSTPVATPVKSAAGAVVIDYNHGNQFTLSEIQPLTNALTQWGAHIVLYSDTDDLATELKAASSYVVISPSHPFTQADTALIHAFVARGGRLAVFTDATRGSVSYDFVGNPVAGLPDVEMVLPLLEPYGISVNADYLYDLDNNEGNFRNVYLKPSEGSDFATGLGMVTFYGTHSVATHGGSPLFVGGQGTLSSSTDALPDEASQAGWAAAAASQDGNVLAFGDFSFLTAPYNQVSDNQLLIARIAEFLFAPREASLADFPFLFRGPAVNLLISDDLQMTAEMTGAISGLQSKLAGSGYELKTVSKAPAQGDLIVLGTYSSGSDLVDYVHPFGLEADDFGASFTLPPFGKVGQSGNGLMLFRTGEQGNTLVLLAESTDDMHSLLETASGDKLEGCLMQGNVAVCSIGFGGSFMDATPTPFLPEELMPGGSTPTPVVPSG